MLKKTALLALITSSLSGQAFSADFKKGLDCYQWEDYACALAEWTPLAKAGHAEAQNNLGGMYNHGRGVQINYNEAVKWFRLAAEQGFTNAKYNLGYMYANGLGVEKDYNKAMGWYEVAAKEGDMDARKNLALMYENGHAADNDVQVPTPDCNGTTKLFNTFIKCANRDEIMVAVKGAGAIVKMEDKSNRSDTYNSSGILKDSNELSIVYTESDLFAGAMYTFPSDKDTQRAIQVRDFVAEKYGKPTSTSEATSPGEVTYQWELEDGIVLSVSRGWPDTTTYLSYIYPKHYKSMVRKPEGDTASKDEVLMKYKSQSDAF